MKVKILNRSKHPLPQYQTVHSAGMDLRANIDDKIIIPPLGRVLVPTGIYIELPEGYEAQIRPRSGLSIKHGITVLNSPGTIDADYRGEIKVILINLSDTYFEINDGDRICQMIVSKYSMVEWEEVELLEESKRGEGGFGHTGK
ncbi:MAG: dUTP diphosphatase [Bacteroidales bacterium]|nr:dUTP diphosphatase [Bacteroidales bacterium]